jgi:peroxiredoxin
LNRPGSGTLSLLFVAALFAVGVGVYALLRPPPVPALRTGSAAPAFSLPVHGGAGEVSLASLRGKVVFVNFWATWCPPCRAEAPSLEHLYQSLRADGFEVLAISIDAPDSASAIDAFRADFALDFPIPLDPRKQVYDAYQVAGVPETFLVDRSGKVVEHFIGPQNWDDPRYSRAIRRALGAPADSGGSAGE